MYNAIVGRTGMTGGDVLEDGVYHGIPQNADFPLTAICGSTKVKDDYLRCIRELTLKGALVIYCPILHHSNMTEISEDKVRMLKDLQKQRIRMCDLLFVVNKNGYIGPGMKEEIDYALSLKKNILFMETIKEEDGVKDGFEEIGK